MIKNILLGNFGGFVFTGIIGTLLHFVFDWSNQNILVGLFSAVNESIGEHIKLLYFPLVLFFVLQSFFIPHTQKVAYANLKSILCGTIAIPTLYYLYTGALGTNADWFNILIFYVADAIAFYVRHKTIKNNTRCFLPSSISKLIILIIGILFIIFTLYPFRIPLFIDPINNTYGYFKIT